MEVGDPIAAAVYNTTKEFARPSDIEPMLRDIFAHPDQGGKHPSFSGLALNMKASPEMKKLVDDTEWTTNPNTDYRQLKLIKDGSEIGRLEYDGHEGEDLYSRIRTSWLAPQYRNQGVAKEMYVKAIADAKKLGIPEFKSDTSVSEDARHVWESLIRDGKYNITKEYTNRFNANGQGGVEYTVHLDKPVTFDVQKAADEFNRSRGKDSIDAAPIPHNPEVAKKIADAYDAMKHNPNDPKVKASYDALAKDVRAQWDYATKEMGIKFEPWTKEGQPYANSKEMVNDVRNNGHLYFFQGGDFPAGHPTQKVDPETGFSTNDMFRAVHDLFGHAAQGFEFGPKGEENAWNVHRQMFSKEAIPALTSETRGQNSWVNFGKHLRDEAGNVAKKGEQGYIPQTQRPYAEQKAGLLPEEFHQPNKLGEIKAQSRVSKVRALANLEKAEDPDVRPIKYPFDASFSPKTTPSTILPDGRITSAVPIHQDVAEAAGFNDVTKFLKATGAVRVMYPEFNQDINSIAVELHQVPTDVQVRVIAHTLQRAANNGVGDGRLIWDLGMGNSYDSGEGSIGAFQRAVKNWAETVSPETGKTPIKAQMKGPWHEVAAQRAQDESAGAIDPRTGMSATEGIGTEIVPEERMPIDHVPTAKDFRSFHDENKSLFEKHPELQVGWDNNSQVPGGHELNIGASGPGAVEVARKLGQRAAFDIGKGEEIPTGGTGTETEFPGYPLEERLKDLKKVKGSSTQLFEKPLKVGESPSPTDVALALSKFTKKQLPGLELGKAAPEAMTARAKDILVDEARYQRAQNNAGQDWYTKDIAKHDDIMKEIRPELENPAKLSIFKMAEAILSAGHEPTDNVAQAVRAWDYYHENGEFAPVNPESGEPWGRYGIKSYGNAFDILNRLIQEKGEQGASDWLLSNHKVSELREYNTAKRGGRGGGIPGEPDDILPGVFVLGEKRGPFAQNLHGQEAAFTHDQWVNRSWNRWMGTADIDKEGKLVDQPRNTKERKIVKQTFEEAAKELGMTTSSLQAVLWYYEKALYEAHGVNKVGASTFSEGAQKVADNESSSFDFGHNEKEKVKK
jgi:GNAT superfamily N-acetyltransferase